MIASALFLSLALVSAAAAPGPSVVGSVQLGTGVRPFLRDLEAFQSVPTFASFDLRADALDTKFMRGRVVLSGWGQLDPGELRVPPVWSYGAVADLNLAFAEGRFFEGNRLTVRLGRQLVTGGAARMLRVDGAMLDAHIAAGFGVSAWAGGVVAWAFAPKPKADFTTGARAYYRFGTDSELGASLVMLRDGSGWARQDLGLDARGRVHRTLTLSGYGVWSIAAARPVDINARATFQPVEMLTVSGDYRRSSPDLFLSQMSIFSVFAEQSRDEAGGEVGLSPHARVSLDGAGYWLRTPSGDGYRANGRVSGRLGSHMQTQVGVEAGVLRAPTAASSRDGYTNVRGFIRTQPTAQWHAALDVANYFLSRAVNGHQNSFSATLVIGFEPTSAWLINASATAGENPYFARYVEAMARVTYRFASGQPQ